jgi:Rab3 GTPase-activating protein regulatory subunit N-terminus/Rab3 GTPase-activating protein regulatory subunit C-terminus
MIGSISCNGNLIAVVNDDVIACYERGSDSTVSLCCTRSMANEEKGSISMLQWITLRPLLARGSSPCSSSATRLLCENIECLCVGFTCGALHFCYLDASEKTTLATLVVQRLHARGAAIRAAKVCEMRDSLSSLLVLFDGGVVVLVEGDSLVSALHVHIAQCLRSRVDDYDSNDAASSSGGGGALLRTWKWCVIDQRHCCDVLPLLDAKRARKIEALRDGRLVERMCAPIDDDDDDDGDDSDMLILAVGAEPMIQLAKVRDGRQATERLIGAVNQVASKLFSFATSWWQSASSDGGDGRRDGGDDGERGDTVEPGLPMRVLMAADDAPRIIESIEWSGDALAALTDSLGRVTLYDVYRMLAVRMWKGYRNARCAFVADKQLAIYAPRRGLLEMWQLRHGPRLRMLNVGERCVLSSRANALSLQTSTTTMGAVDGGHRCYLWRADASESLLLLGDDNNNDSDNDDNDDNDDDGDGQRRPQRQRGRTMDDDDEAAIFRFLNTFNDAAAVPSIDDVMSTLADCQPAAIVGALLHPVLLSSDARSPHFTASLCTRALDTLAGANASRSHIAQLLSRRSLLCIYARCADVSVGGDGRLSLADFVASWQHALQQQHQGDAFAHSVRAAADQDALWRVASLLFALDSDGVACAFDELRIGAADRQRLVFAWLVRQSGGDVDDSLLPLLGDDRSELLALATNCARLGRVVALAECIGDATLRDAAAERYALQSRLPEQSALRQTLTIANAHTTHTVHRVSAELGTLLDGADACVVAMHAANSAAAASPAHLGEALEHLARVGDTRHRASLALLVWHRSVRAPLQGLVALLAKIRRTPRDAMLRRKFYSMERTAVAQFALDCNVLLHVLAEHASDDNGGAAQLSLSSSSNAVADTLLEQCIVLRATDWPLCIASLERHAALAMLCHAIVRFDLGTRLPRPLDCFDEPSSLFRDVSLSSSLSSSSSSSSTSSSATSAAVRRQLFDLLPDSQFRGRLASMRFTC